MDSSKDVSQQTAPARSRAVAHDRSESAATLPAVHALGKAPVQKKENNTGRVQTPTIQREGDAEEEAALMAHLSRPVAEAPADAAAQPVEGSELDAADASGAAFEMQMNGGRPRGGGLLDDKPDHGLFGHKEYAGPYQAGMGMMGAAKASGELGLRGAEGAVKLGAAGVSKSYSAAKSGVKAGGNIAAAPARWAAEGIKNTKNPLKKAGYAVGGVLGTAVSAPLGLAAATASVGAGLVGAGTSAALGATGALAAGSAGLAGAATGAALGGVGIAGGAAVEGARYAGKEIGAAIPGKNEIMGVYGKGATHEFLGDRGPSRIDAPGEYNPDGTRKNYGAIGDKEKLTYGLLGTAGAATVGAATTDFASKGGDLTKAGIQQSGFTSGLAGGAEAFASIGAVGGIMGAGAAMVDAGYATKEAADASNSKSTRVLAGGQAASSLSDATKSSATAAYNIASIIDAHGVAAAGAQIAAGGASIAMGTIDMIRGGYGTYTALERKTLLEGIKKSSRDPRIQGAAEEAIQTQKRAAVSGGLQMVKGGLAIAGGILLIASMASPVGWMLLGIGAVVGIAAAIASWWSKRGHKKSVAMRELGVKEVEMTNYTTGREARQEAIKNETRPLSANRKQKMEQLDSNPLYGSKDPLKRKLEEYKFSSIGHFYTNYINATANKIYTDGVIGKDEKYESIISNIGLKTVRADEADHTKWTPTPDKIAKALGG